MCTHTKSVFVCSHSHINLLHRCLLSRLIGLPCPSTTRSLREVHNYPGACRTCLETARVPYHNYRHRAPPERLEEKWKCCYCKTEWKDGGDWCNAWITWVERDERGELRQQRGRCGHGRCISCDSRGRVLGGRM